jgi:hypothetical protein
MQEVTCMTVMMNQLPDDTNNKHGIASRLLATSFWCVLLLVLDQAMQSAMVQQCKLYTP